MTTRITSTDLTNFYRTTIGADRIIGRILDTIENQSNTTNYPPYNIIRISENETEVQVAVAGFSIDELAVNVDNGSLIITGEKQNEDTNNYADYVHHGISARKFTRTWTLAENVEVTSANAKDGILSVKLFRLIPDVAKAKAIPITYAG